MYYEFLSIIHFNKHILYSHLPHENRQLPSSVLKSQGRDRDLRRYDIIQTGSGLGQRIILWPAKDKFIKNTVHYACSTLNTMIFHDKHTCLIKVKVRMTYMTFISNSSLHKSTVF